jgi:hypothetical protein
MKALTICQPWAQLIMRGEKRVENREWSTSHRGPLFIHAGKSRDWLLEDDEAEFEAAHDPLVFGAILGIATLDDVLHIDRIRRGDYDTAHPWLRAHEHTGGPWCWILRNVHRLTEPRPWKGSLGLWDAPGDLAAAPTVPIVAQVVR